MTLIQRLLAVLLAAFFAFGILGYTGSMVESHHTMGDGTAHHVCPLMGTTPACVSIFEHLSHWQNSFTAVLAEIIPLALLLFSIACACLWFVHQQVYRLLSALSLSPPKLLYAHALLPRHRLQEAFASGILNSKAY